jgi:DNA repair photolyase
MSSPKTPQPGRGAVSNPEGRFESRRVAPVDDGWPSDAEAEELPPLETTVTAERAKRVISRNDSPDVGFEQSINPYRGCEHGCIYCVGPDTQILMADGTTRALAEIRPGDQIYGTVRHGHYRQYIRTAVLAHWETEKPAYRITLEDSTELIASGDHRFLTLRGWKFVTGAECGRERRPHLTPNDSLLGVGSTVQGNGRHAAYKRGYLCGMIRGDGHLATHSYLRAAGHPGELHQFRLALVDQAGVDRTAAYLEDFGVPTRRFVFVNERGMTPHLHAIRTQRRSDVDCIRRFVAWPSTATSEWARGFLAGIFDAEGSYSTGVLRISNTDDSIIDATTRCLRQFGFDLVAECPMRRGRRPITVLRIRGGLKEHLRFFHATDPAILRKRNIETQALKSNARLRVVSIEPIGCRTLFDVTTGTGDFIANGVVSHNCYARPSHSYVNLSPGLDFETKIFFKAHAAQLLEAELRKPGYVCKPINLGANTDPYQPAERKLRVTRSILEVLQRHRHPVTIVTKSALIARDLDILVDLARDGLVSAFVSITTLDAALKRKLEPRAPAPAARLRAVRALREAGVPVGVLVAPVIPAVTDHEIERILAAAAQAGAQTAGYVLIRLPYEVKTLFREWLDAHLPERAEHVMSLIRATRNGRENDPRFGSRMRGEGAYAELIGRRFETACRRLGLLRHRESGLCTQHFRPYHSAENQLTLL